MADKLLRCAVYTRKSTEDGLDQEFNSLDAQYEACAAYALSQKHEGWQLLPGRYDDGGFSGGNMQRPGLQRLLADVAAGKVDIILVYKIDRLTRSLADFAKIVEVLDTAQASFVSITQAFNTTTSMGRLTLNMLLSFAQFEREVTGERIRDKIAASKRKGLWMGGPVPLGYDVENRKLVVNAKEAELVRHIMARYLVLGSVAELADELNHDGYRTKVQVRASGPHKGGCRFQRGTLYHLLANCIYLGELSHKGQHFAGEHQAIVPQELFDKVQAKLAANAAGKARRVKAAQPSLLVGLLTDGEGRAMTPSHACKPGKRYRYYVTRPDLVGQDAPAWRVPADDLEELVSAHVAKLLDDKHLLCELAGDVPADTIRQMFAKADMTAATIRSGQAHERSQLLNSLVAGVTLMQEGVDLAIDKQSLAELLGFVWQNEACEPQLVLQLSATRIRKGRQLRLIIPGPDKAPQEMPQPDEKLLSLLAEARRAQHLVLSQPNIPLARIATAHKLCRKRLGKLIAVSCLAPDIVAAVTEGSPPSGLTVPMLLETELPMEWGSQRQMLGFV